MPVYPTNISKEEREAGFSIGWIDNPEGNYGIPAFREPEPVAKPKIHAIICQVGPSDRVIKKQYPDGSLIYRSQRYGKTAVHPECSAKWTTIEEVYSLSPSNAVSKAKGWIGENVTPKITTLIPEDKCDG